MSKDAYSTVGFSRNVDVASASLLYLREENNKKPEKQNIVTNI